jgi:hypothetical protein
MRVLHDFAQDGFITGADLGLKGPCNANWQSRFEGAVDGLRSESMRQYSRDR